MTVKAFFSTRRWCLEMFSTSINNYNVKQMTNMFMNNWKVITREVAEDFDMLISELDLKLLSFHKINSAEQELYFSNRYMNEIWIYRHDVKMEIWKKTKLRSYMPVLLNVVYDISVIVFLYNLVPKPLHRDAVSSVFAGVSPRWYFPKLKN